MAISIPDFGEIRNPGLLLPGISLEELRQGKVRSKPRNPVIATVLRDFPGGYMERVGSGISFMISQMRELGLPDPQFREQGEFIVTFSRTAPSASEEPNSSQSEESLPPPTRKKRSQMSGERISPNGDTEALRKKRQKLALRYVHTHGFITDKRYQTITGTSGNTTLRDLEALIEQGSHSEPSIRNVAGAISYNHGREVEASSTRPKNRASFPSSNRPFVRTWGQAEWCGHRQPEPPGSV